MHTERRRPEFAALRQRVDQMTREQIVAALYTDSMTGAMNRRALDECADEVAAVGFCDLDNLHWLDKNLGHEAGDEVIRRAAKALALTGLTVYRLGGDEFVVHGRSLRHVALALAVARKALAGAEISGQGWIKQGVGISYGVGRTRDEADRGALADKARREANGERAGRHDVPPGAFRINEQEAA